MKRQLCTLLLLLAAPLAWADEKPKPNTLTPQEIADGWILLFDGETTFGWRIEGEAKVENGSLVLGGERETVATPTSMFGSCEIKLEGHEEGKRIVNVSVTRGEGHLSSSFNGLGDKFWSELRFRSEINPSTGSNDLKVVQPSGAVGSMSNSDTGPTRFYVKVTPGTKVLIRNVKLRPLKSRSIFDGKDLSGWTEVKDPKRKTNSKFFVENGELRIKDGPGDLQTEGQWDDFILQMDVKTNGKHLNSGVFFRCLPGQFWAGYESQIRNQWVGDDRTKPVDFGTGAIYRRQAARRVVANDNEWFTKTIIAHGNHMAVWVNGYQVTDFTDTRPPNDNARNGTKTGKGPISLQGHDPTTDLSFRNIRIAELPKSKNGK